MNQSYKVTHVGRWMIFAVAFGEYILPVMMLIISPMLYPSGTSEMEAEDRIAEVGTPLLYIVGGIWLFRFLLEIFPLCLVFFYRSYQASLVLFTLHLPVWGFGAFLAYCATVQIPERGDSIQALLSLLVLLGLPIFLYIIAIRRWVAD